MQGGPHDSTNDGADEHVPGSVDADMLEKCRRLAAVPANAPGADKTWVLVSIRRIQRLLSSPQPTTREQQMEAMRLALDALKPR